MKLADVVLLRNDWQWEVFLYGFDLEVGADEKGFDGQNFLGNRQVTCQLL